ncbi:CsbD family protein [Rhodococcus sp. HNM0569]|uniref:CsbD family protein n=1 Tax=Rhodococcus sp. HNM0569 TaxID=2716340 RepID=UPI00146F069F|nr:CsbD family protein [Rhodococcus sp. HNM0569]NLU83532.1 CsbD family protein [Rhodococcus sp. HNM0569]
MGLDDKAQNKADDVAGKAKEAVGSATDDKDLENEGKGDQVKSSVKDAGEKIKDAARDAKDKLS